MDLPPRKIRFLLVNGVSEQEAKAANYFIYAHVCHAGMYIGMSNDPVKRWQEHYSNAFNTGYRDYDDDFRKAIRGWKQNFKHYILATANFETRARKLEASAIHFYPCNLNMRNEIESERIDYNFRSLESQVVLPYILEKRGGSAQKNRMTDRDRVAVVGVVYKEFGRKRLKVIAGQAFPEGMNISCDKTELENFNYGDHVRIKVSETSRSGTKFLKAANTASLTLVK